MNHTSDQHPWFQRARRAPPGSPERDFYVWSETPDKYQEARIIFKDFEASNWAWDPVAKAYYWHRFYSHQPDLNFENPQVEKAMLDVLDFWMDLGVDGLRLDAVPYLFEAEGSNCENLPATHAILKRVHAHIVERYGAERMLLAEANQWPEDAVAYFGKGDECQMAFHFPLMPRMFMALRMEERFPITDILEQTPDIPGNCQWALFLRNHDELTLEMVTDEERDYMYRTYARDREARINLGIRRRLSPLVDNDRRRIELLHTLLFSMPGTPVIYYGDEIGMGDNIFLGDRNGVRTPMQWSPDRNGGFSSAHPQRMYLPLILDPDHHYESVNVENQQRNPYSLLWWMRRRLELRRRFPVFGSGRIQFLHPDNPKVLAFLRYVGDTGPGKEGDVVLVAANLSASPQTTTLDLSALTGRTVEELSSLSTFPPIAEGAYPMMLGPYGYYWLLLKPMRPSAGQGARPGKVLRMKESDWAEVLQGQGKEALERDILPAWLPTRRWFGGKGRSIMRAVVMDRVFPPGAGDPGYGTEWALAFIRVEYSDGPPEGYLLPLARALGQDAEAVRREHAGAILTELRDGETSILYEGIYHAGFRAAMHRMMAAGYSWHGLTGILRGHARKDAFAAAGETDEPSQVLSAEQSNSAVVFPGRHFVKFLRRLDEGENPDLEILRFFDEHTAFRRVPPYAGHLEYASGAGGTYTLAIAEGLIENQGDAWSHSLKLAGAHLARVLKPGAPGSEDALDPRAAEFAGLLGHRSAEMHLALASRSDLPAFAPEPFSRLYQRSLYQSMRNQAARIYERLSKNLPNLPEERAELGRRVLGARSKVMGAYAGLLDHLIPTMKIRVHGDYHLGQVLMTGDDVLILDFEGEPARPLSERKLKRSPWKDVAGMLRSFHYAIHSAWPKEESLSGERKAVAEARAEKWPQAMADSFLRAYLETAKDASFIPPEKDREILLRAYLMEKAVYELGYELNNRPDWAHIPMAGILSLVEPA
jgi:maltose alpha-D-glucosyltransferase/alpha-amylase